MVKGMAHNEALNNGGTSAPDRTPIGWMISPADLLHGPLSWLLCGLVVGHIAMALIHRYWLKDNVLARMVEARDR
ncbi:hypothetical protein GCM10007158_04320 [Vreelandella hamiltonii]|uniref:Cytochrome b561 bacterial/Ni-hydrogenase domain-containing protein n=2 Tax=Halomonadaceae TaxID=28256 RepID=A0ABQ2WAR1_9GAMM|nr:hypothetical protein GCM10007158_04320 [Halomonas johnsoniae]